MGPVQIIRKIRQFLDKPCFDMRYFTGLIFTGITPVPTLTYTSQYFTPFNNASWNFGNMTPILFSVVGDFFGQPIGNQIVYGSMLVNILGLVWVRQEDAAIPLFLSFALSAILFSTPGIVPTPWLWFIGGVQIIVMAGIGYTLWRGRRNS